MRPAARMVLAALSLGGCRRADPPPPPLYDIGVVVWRADDPGGLSVDVRLRDVRAFCSAPAPWPPEPGRCTTFSDAGSPPCGSWRCLSGVRLEQAGRVIASARREDGLHARLEVPRLETDATVHLVIDGCGTAARVRVPTETLPAPRIIGITKHEGGFRVDWGSAEAATGVVVSGGDGFGGQACHHVGRTTAHVGASHPGLVGLVAVATEPAVETPFGTVRVARATPAAEP